MHRIFRVKAYEAEHGPHFNEEHARKAVSKMENEDGTRGPHWSIYVINIILINKEKKPLLNAMKKWLSAKYYQISWEQIMNQLERTIKYQSYRKKLVN